MNSNSFKLLIWRNLQTLYQIRQKITFLLLNFIQNQNVLNINIDRNNETKNNERER